MSRYVQAYLKKGGGGDAEYNCCCGWDNGRMTSSRKVMYSCISVMVQSETKISFQAV